MEEIECACCDAKEGAERDVCDCLCHHRAACSRVETATWDWWAIAVAAVASLS